MAWFCAANVEARYINLDRRLDRRGQFEKEIIDTKALGDVVVKRFRAFDVPRSGALGCARSHVSALHECLSESKPYFLIMEDDCQLEVPPQELLQAINKMPAPSDTGSPILCLSYHPPRIQLQGLVGKHPLKFGSTARATEIQTTSAYVVTRLFAEIGLLPCFEQSVRELSRNVPGATAAIDVKWKDLQKVTPFSIAVPRLIRQRVDHSDIMNRVLDYGGGCETLLRVSDPHLVESSCFHTTVFPEQAQLFDMLSTALETCSSMRHFFVCLVPQNRFNGTRMFQQWLKHMSPVATRPVALFTPTSKADFVHGFFISRGLAEDWVKSKDDRFTTLLTLCKEKNKYHKTDGWINC